MEKSGKKFNGLRWLAFGLILPTVLAGNIKLHRTNFASKMKDSKIVTTTTNTITYSDEPTELDPTEKEIIKKILENLKDLPPEEEFLPLLILEDTIKEPSVFRTTQLKFLLRNTTKYYLKDEYTNLNFFLNFNRQVERKNDRGTFTIDELVNNVCLTNQSNDIANFIEVSHDTPTNLIPYGRKGDYIDRDYMFYCYTKSFINSNEFNNTLFINYTGHPGSIAAVLASKGIPTYWQMDFSTAFNSEEETLNEIQDYSSEIQNNAKNDTTNMGLMLYPKHKPWNNHIKSELLPSIEYLQKQGIKKIIVLSEEHFGQVVNIDKAFIPDQSFADYLKLLRQNGFPISVVGVDTKDPKTFVSDFEYPYTIKNSNPIPYLTNFGLGNKITIKQ